MPNKAFVAINRVEQGAAAGDYVELDQDSNIVSSGFVPAVPLEYHDNGEIWRAKVADALRATREPDLIVVFVESAGGRY